MASNYSQRSNSSGSSRNNRSSSTSGKPGSDKRTNPNISRKQAGRYANTAKTNSNTFAERVEKSKAASGQSRPSSAPQRAGASYRSSTSSRTTPSRSSSSASRQPARSSYQSTRDPYRNSSSNRTARTTAPTRGASASRPRQPESPRQQSAPRRVGDVRAQERNRAMSAAYRRFLFKSIGALVIALLVLAGGIFIYNSSLFSVTTVTVSGNYYLSEDEVKALADIPDDTTLLRLSAKQIEENLLASPWVDSVEVNKTVPHTVEIVVNEKSIAAEVEIPISTASTTVTKWAIAQDGTWLTQIDETKAILEVATSDTAATDTASSDTTAAATGDTAVADISTDDASTDGASTTTDAATDTSTDVAGDTAAFDAVVTTDAATAETSTQTTTAEYDLATKVATDAATKPLIKDVLSTVVPQAGVICDDEGITNALSILSILSTDLSDQLISISAASAEQTSLTLANGVTIAFGSSDDAQAKERVALQLLAEHEGAISYINVRVVDRPAWRGLETS